MQRKKSKFQDIVWDFYKNHGRHALPWRLTHDPYKILVSEIMLQQTQVDRVIPFYIEFIRHFPSTDALARAKTSEVLTLWQGLGYNRRALNLHRAAQEIVKKYGCTFPTEYSALLALPGVGKATAGDILAFAYNKPAVVIETNIRTVFIHHFFTHKENISDKEIEKQIEKTLDTDHPREWYYGLMDYGSHLKKTMGSNIHQSKHHKKQSPFKGSKRQKNAARLKRALARGAGEAALIKLLSHPKRKK